MGIWPQKLPLLLYVVHTNLKNNDEYPEKTSFVIKTTCLQVQPSDKNVVTHQILKVLCSWSDFFLGI